MQTSYNPDTGAITGAKQINADGSQTDYVVNADGSQSATAYNTAGQATIQAQFNANGSQEQNFYNPSGALIGQIQVGTDGTQTDYVPNADGSLSATVFNDAGQEVEQAKINPDGSQSDIPIDDDTGSPIDTSDDDDDSGGDDTQIADSSGGDDGDFGFAGNQQVIDATLASGTNPIPATGVWAQAEQRGLAQARQSADGSAGQASVDEGAKWGGQKVITWSLATDGSGNAAQQAEEEAAAQRAFAAWSAASGLVFEEVDGNASASIRIGWGDLNTTSTGVVGTPRSGRKTGRSRARASNWKRPRMPRWWQVRTGN